MRLKVYITHGKAKDDNQMIIGILDQKIGARGANIEFSEIFFEGREKITGLLVIVEREDVK